MDTADPPDPETLPTAKERLRGLIVCDCVRTAVARVQLCETELARAVADLRTALTEFGCREE